MGNTLVWISCTLQRKKVATHHEHEEEEYFEEGKGHISVKKMKVWLALFRDTGFIVQRIRRGSLLLGGPRYNRHPLLFALLLLIDQLFDHLPLTKNFTEAHTYQLRKLAPTTK